MTNPCAEIELPMAKWHPREAGRVVEGVPRMEILDDGFVHRMMKEREESDSFIRIVRCKNRLVGPSSWKATDEPVDCLLCIADEG